MSQPKSDKKNNFYITTPIYYINDKAHIGHAYTTITADVLARYHRGLGDEVLFATGTDENSQKTVQAAEKVGQDIVSYTDEMALKWQETWERLGVNVDVFIRTTEERHKTAVYEMLDKLKKSDDIYEGLYEGLYCVGCEEFKRPDDLVEGKCQEHNQIPELIKEKNHFFRLSKYADQIKDHIKKNPDFISPVSRKNEILSFIEQGLDDISVTRESVEWGIPFPDSEGEVLYVWIDALTNYLTVTGYPSDGYDRWWPADIHVVGKNIIKFHCIIWPAMLMSAGLPLPKQILAHGFLNVGGTKISKSLGNAIDPIDLANDYGNDALRFLLLRIVPFGDDGDFTMEHFKALYNAELANDLGNLVQRTVKMIERYQGGSVGPLKEAAHDVKEYHDAMKGFRFDRALEHVWVVIKSTNQYLEEEKPWSIDEPEAEHRREVLAYCVSNLVHIAQLLTPFMPDTSKKIIDIFSDEKVTNPGILFPRLD